MGRHCCVTSCRSYSVSGRTVNGLSFYKFPTWKKTEGGNVAEITKRRRMAWVSAVRRTNITFNYTPPSMKVCSLHFHSGESGRRGYAGGLKRQNYGLNGRALIGVSS
ncbi:unnamed protein product [Merluccius merluccius]